MAHAAPLGWLLAGWDPPGVLLPWATTAALLLFAVLWTWGLVRHAGSALGRLALALPAFTALLASPLAWDRATQPLQIFLTGVFVAWMGTEKLLCFCLGRGAIAYASSLPAFASQLLLPLALQVRPTISHRQRSASGTSSSEGEGEAHQPVSKDASAGHWSWLWRHGAKVKKEAISSALARRAALKALGVIALTVMLVGSYPVGTFPSVSPATSVAHHLHHGAGAAAPGLGHVRVDFAAHHHPEDQLLESALHGAPSAVEQAAALWAPTAAAAAARRATASFSTLISEWWEGRASTASTFFPALAWRVPRPSTGAWAKLVRDMTSAWWWPFPSSSSLHTPLGPTTPTAAVTSLSSLLTLHHFGFALLLYCLLGCACDAAAAWYLAAPPAAADAGRQSKRLAHTLPSSDRPWRASSLSEFWSDRWCRPLTHSTRVWVYETLVPLLRGRPLPSAYGRARGHGGGGSWLQRSGIDQVHVSPSYRSLSGGSSLLRTLTKPWASLMDALLPETRPVLQLGQAAAARASAWGAAALHSAEAAAAGLVHPLERAEDVGRWLREHVSEGLGRGRGRRRRGSDATSESEGEEGSASEAEAASSGGSSGRRARSKGATRSRRSSKSGGGGLASLPLAVGGPMAAVEEASDTESKARGRTQRRGRGGRFVSAAANESESEGSEAQSPASAFVASEGEEEGSPAVPRGRVAARQSAGEASSEAPTTGVSGKTRHSPGAWKQKLAAEAETAAPLMQPTPASLRLSARLAQPTYSPFALFKRSSGTEGISPGGVGEGQSTWASPGSSARRHGGAASHQASSFSWWWPPAASKLVRKSLKSLWPLSPLTAHRIASLAAMAALGGWAEVVTWYLSGRTSGGLLNAFFILHGVLALVEEAVDWRLLTSGLYGRIAGEEAASAAATGTSSSRSAGTSQHRGGSISGGFTDRLFPTLFSRDWPFLKATVEATGLRGRRGRIPLQPHAYHHAASGSRSNIHLHLPSDKVLAEAWHPWLRYGRRLLVLATLWASSELLLWPAVSATFSDLRLLNQGWSLLAGVTTLALGALYGAAEATPHIQAAVEEAGAAALSTAHKAAVQAAGAVRHEVEGIRARMPHAQHG